MHIRESLIAVPFLAASLIAQAVVQPRPQIDLSNGAAYERGTDISSAPRFRGVATSPAALAPRNAGEVWTSKLVYHAWAMESGSAGDRDVYFARSVDGGITFETPRRLDQQVGSAEEVSVAANGHTVCVSWLSNEMTGDDHVYALVSLDQGVTFQGPFLLNDPNLVPLGDTDEHWLAAGSSSYYFVWEYDDRGRAATTGDEDVRFNRIDIVGSSLQVGLDVRLNQPGSSNIDDVDSPIVLSDPSTNDVAVFWFDDRGGVAGNNGMYGGWSRNAGIDFPLAQDTLVVGPPTADVRNRNNVIGVAFTPPGFDIDDPFHAVTPGRHDIVVSFKDAYYGAGNDLSSSGLRVPYVRLTAPFQTGNQVAIEVAQIAESNRNGLAVLVYQGAASPVLPGFYPLHDGIDVDVTFDSVTLAFLGIQPLSVLAIPTGGRATTPAIRVPPGYQAPSFRVQAVVFDASLQARETSDPFLF